MLGLYIALAFLGLSAIDPIGIGIMPVLLTQRRPYQRALVFLGGSFIALFVMGLLLSRGLGHQVLRIELDNRWLKSTAETVGATILLSLAVYIYIRSRDGRVSVSPSKKTTRWLKLGNGKLFTLGALLVSVQSLVDVVFVLAMIRIGQLKLSNIKLVSAVITYAVAALLLQIVVVCVYRFAPSYKRDMVLSAVRSLLTRYTNQVLISVSLVLSIILYVLALRS